MPTITVRNLPEDLHTGLRSRAAAARRSVNQEVLHALDLYVRGGRPGFDEEKIRALRALARKPVDEETLARYRAEGREP